MGERIDRERVDAQRERLVCAWCFVLCSLIAWNTKPAPNTKYKVRYEAGVAKPKDRKTVRRRSACAGATARTRAGAHSCFIDQRRNGTRVGRARQQRFVTGSATATRSCESGRREG